MPLLNLATGNGVEGLSVVLNGVNKYLEDGSINPEAILWNYGNFLQSIINFLIIALCIFTTLRIIMNIRKASEKIAEKAKHTFDSKPEDAPAEAAQEVVAAAAEEEQQKQEQATQDAQPQEEVAAETAPQEVAKETVEDMQVKESQEDILRQIRDLLLTMQPKEKQSATKQPAKKTNKTK